MCMPLTSVHAGAGLPIILFILSYLGIGLLYPVFDIILASVQEIMNPSAF